MPRSSKLAAGIAAVFVVAAMPAATQQVYKWVDENGRVHYSNSPPPGGAARGSVQAVEPKVSTMPAPSVDPSAPRSQREQDLQRRVEQLEREQAAQQRAATTPSRSAAAEEEAIRQWREQCRANRGTDCEGIPYYEPSYGTYYPPVVRPPIANRPGFPSVVPPGYTVGPGPGGVGGAYVPMPEPPRPQPPAPMAPPRRPVPLQQ